MGVYSNLSLITLRHHRHQRTFWSALS